MTPQQVIKKAQDAGVQLSVNGDKLHLHYYGDEPADLKPLLKRHKKAIIALLLKTPCPLDALSQEWRSDLCAAVAASRKAGYDFDTICNFDLASHPHLTLDQIQAAWNKAGSNEGQER